MVLFGQNFNFFQEGIIKKISYDRRVYESVTIRVSLKLHSND